MTKKMIFSLFTALLASVSLWSQGPRAMRPGQRGQGPIWEHFLGRMDSNGDGSISQDEFQGANLTRFQAMDTNQDGFITEEEFTSSHPGPAGPGLGGPFFLEADSNDDQVITSDEWSAFVQALEVDDQGGVVLPGRGNGPVMRHDSNENGILEPSEVLAMFDVLDQNDDGQLDSQDRPEGRRGGFGNGDLMGPPWLASADQDDDQRITAEEWQAFLSSITDEDGNVNLSELIQQEVQTRMIQRLDINQDGVVSADEMQVLFDRMDHNDDDVLSAEDRQGRGQGKHGKRGRMGRNKRGM